MHALIVSQYLHVKFYAEFVHIVIGAGHVRYELFSERAVSPVSVRSIYHAHKHLHKCTFMYDVLMIFIVNVNSETKELV